MGEEAHQEEAGEDQTPCALRNKGFNKVQQAVEHGWMGHRALGGQERSSRVERSVGLSAQRVSLGSFRKL